LKARGEARARAQELAAGFAEGKQRLPTLVCGIKNGSWSIEPNRFDETPEGPRRGGDPGGERTPHNWLPRARLHGRRRSGLAQPALSDGDDVRPRASAASSHTRLEDTRPRALSSSRVRRARPARDEEPWPTWQTASDRSAVRQCRAAVKQAPMRGRRRDRRRLLPSDVERHERRCGSPIRSRETYDVSLAAIGLLTTGARS
jgi:hypothetical protein